MKQLIALFALALLPSLAAAQTSRPFVRASGEGIVSFKPDQMKLGVGVVTQAETAQQASEDNATKSAAVIAAIQKLLGSSGDLKTVSYSLTPVYKYPQGGGQATLVGFTASNQLQVTTGDLSVAGRLIDIAVEAGATNIGSISFSLKDPQPAKGLALKLATIQAKAQAEAIASGLSAKIGSIISVQEASTATYSPTRSLDSAGAGNTTTPIETGMVEIRASVVLEAELAQ